MTDLKIFMGYDSREDIAYQVAERSIRLYNSEIPVIPLKQQALRDQGVYWRDLDKAASTEFTITRFLTPYLSEYSGWSLFIDCDVLLLTDIQQLFDLRDDKYAIQVVKHDYNPVTSIKMDNKPQALYPRKNWSSVMLFNNAHPANKALDLAFVNSATPQTLHRLQWLSDNLIGELPTTWNWLVDWYSETDNLKPKLLHYTEGGPWFSDYVACSYSQNWYKVRDLLNN